MVSGTTPHFAAIVTGKYSAQSGRAVRTDLQRTMQRSVSVDFIQSLAGEVGKTVTAKERYPAYQIQTPADKIHAVVMAADSTCVPNADRQRSDRGSLPACGQTTGGHQRSPLEAKGTPARPVPALPAGTRHGAGRERACTAYRVPVKNSLSGRDGVG